MPPPHRQAVVILGMHRSGTSAFAGTTVRLGLLAPATPLPASADNAEGFYESQPVVTANHEILLARHCRWNVCLGFEPDQASQLLDASDRQYIVDILRAEFGTAGSFVLKDPRMCLTFPVWRTALQTFQVQTRVLIVLRHPIEVVQSLAARNEMTEADTASHWLHHMLEAEWASRALPRAVLRYSDLLRGWQDCMTRAAAQASILWPQQPAAVDRLVETFLTATGRLYSLDHPSARVGSEPVCDMVNAAWVAFQALAENPTGSLAQVCLDQIRARFADWRRAKFPGGAQATS
jgi:hypothetical protein